MNGDGSKDCLPSRPEVRLDFPVGPDVYVFDVRDKIFATLGRQDTLARINLKCDPRQVPILRAIFDAVVSGCYANKARWNP